MLKRTFDILASAFALIALLPVLAAAALWVRFDSPGPIFYCGRRSGRGGEVFGMLKFRSMVSNADRIGGPSTSGDDARVTTSGKLLRRFKIDELPQLINVLRGEMSLVGPRPEVVSKVERYTEVERRILSVRPGITDWASIWNCDEGGVLAGAPDADAAYEAVIRPYKLELQIAYASQRTFLSDIKILAYTLLRIFMPGISPREISGYPSQDEMREKVADYVTKTRQSAAA